MHGIAHRQRCASGKTIRLVPRYDPGTARGVSADSFEGLDSGGDRLVYAAYRAAGTRYIRRDAVGRIGQFAGRGRGDFRSGNPQANLSAQGRWGNLANGASHGTSARPASECHHALRPPRKCQASHRPSAAVAATFRTTRAGFRHLCHWRFIRKIHDYLNTGRASGTQRIGRASGTRICVGRRR